MAKTVSDCGGMKLIQPMKQITTTTKKTTTKKTKSTSTKRK